jgi:hypothetical protein
MCVAGTENIDKDRVRVDELLRELDELRELDRRRHAHAPGSPAHDAASSEVDSRSRRLMNRFRDALPADLDSRRAAASSSTRPN